MLSTVVALTASSASPLRLYESDPSGEASTSAAGWMIVIAVVAACAGGVILFHMRRRQWGVEADDAGRAFVRLCQNLHLRPRHARAIRALASGIGAPPVTLVVCESVFMRALASGDSETRVDRAVVLEAASRLFRNPATPTAQGNPKSVADTVDETGHGKPRSRGQTTQPARSAEAGVGSARADLMAALRRHKGAMDRGPR